MVGMFLEIVPMFIDKDLSQPRFVANYSANNSANYSANAHFDTYLRNEGLPNKIPKNRVQRLTESKRDPL